MTKLSTTQADLLTAAAQSDDGTTIANSDAKSAVAGLIRRGFFISTPQPEGPSRLLITQAGRSAIGAADEPAAGDTNPSQASGKKRATAPEPATKPARQPAKAPKSAAKPTGKIALLVGLLRQPGGASIEAMMGATGWQAHSVRGALSGAVKKGLGLAIVSEKTEGDRIYRIADEAAA